MSTKLIQTKNYLLLIDEEAEIKEGNYYLTHLENIYQETKRPFEEDADIERFTNRKLYKCILAHYPLTEEAKELDLPLLPNFTEKDNIDKIANEWFLINNYNKEDLIHSHSIPNCITTKNLFIEGYKAAQSNKRFSLEDMKKAIEMATWINPINN